MRKSRDDKTYKEKKSETLEVRLPYSVKRAFMQAARDKGETASQVIRGFIDQYLDEARQIDRRTILQEMIMTIDHNRKKTAVLLTGFAAAAFTFAALPSAAEGDVFAMFDKNGDGVLTDAELGWNGETLDLDGSGSISREEFKSQANIVELEMPEGISINGTKRIFIEGGEDDAVLASLSAAIKENFSELSEAEQQKILWEIAKAMEEDG